MLAAGPAADDGGFFSDTWGWIAVLALAAATALLVVRPWVELGVLDAVFLGGLALLTGWAALSALWTPSVTSTLNDVARLLSYVGAVALCLLVVRRRTAAALLLGVLAGVTAVCGYALLTRLLPGKLSDFEGLSTYRLSVPIDYWNGLGAYAAMGTVLALGLAARAEGRVLRGLAAGATVVLAPTVYFTFSRGAWIALVAGLLAAVLAGPRRVQLLWVMVVVGPWPALAVIASSQSEALTVRGSSLADATHAGKVLLLVLVGLLLVAAALGALIAHLEPRFEIETEVRVAFVSLLLAAAIGVVAVGWARYDAPWALADRGWEQFWSQTNGDRGGANLGTSVFTLASNGRARLWHAAWEGFESDPAVGTGAGSFAHTWYLRRPTEETAVNEAHGLYVETLSELGVVGASLLALMLAAPIVAVVRAQRFTALPAAAGAYAAFLVAAGVDWQWELAGVSLVALLAGGAVVAAARREAPPRRLSTPLRVAAPLATGALAAVALVGLLANYPLARAREAGNDLAAVTRETERARRWAPWSSEPWRLLGDAQVSAGRTAAARASFERAVREEPESWELWFRLGLASSGGERRAALERARSLNPRDRGIQSLLSPP